MPFRFSTKKGRLLRSGLLDEYNAAVLHGKGNLDSSRVFPDSARPVSWLAFDLCHPFPERILQWTDGVVRLTVAGPRRIFTGFPSILRKKSGYPSFLILCRGKGFVKKIHSKHSGNTRKILPHMFCPGSTGRELPYRPSPLPRKRQALGRWQNHRRRNLRNDPE